MTAGLAHAAKEGQECGERVRGSFVIQAWIIADHAASLANARTRERARARLPVTNGDARVTRCVTRDLQRLARAVQYPRRMRFRGSSFGRLGLAHIARGLAFVASFGALAAMATLGASCATASFPENNVPDSGVGSGICLLHNCGSDGECGGCTLGRTRCLPAEGRCVACDSETDTGCTEGERCSEFGQCVPDGLACPVDDHGEPAVACATDIDCAACDPQHRICDLSQGGLCVGCTAENTSECPTNDACVDGKCSPACPEVCTADGDCSSCGAEGSEAHACNAHKCAQCSPTLACPEGQSCTPKGICVTVCGTDGSGACMADADCAGCGEASTTCHLTMAGGTCGPSAGTCDDLLGNGSLLPEPWGAATQLCADESECAGVSADVNIGKTLRFMTGLADIKDGTVPYAIDKCAEVTAGDEPPLVCGVCVPCTADTDCEDINVDPVSEQIFGPKGSPDAAYLEDQVFGTSPHVVHMYCDMKGVGFGVCAACPGIVNDCGVGGGGGGGGTCDHDPCMTGSALDGSCDMCAAMVCPNDSYCCDTAWDAVCVDEAEQYCGLMCGMPVGCVHDECVEGVKLDPACSMCATDLCAADPYCCDTEWDVYCVEAVPMYCGFSCP
jgi:hypothetical protein